MRYLILSLLLVFSLEGCASTGSGPGTSRNLITRAQIEESQAITAYDVIRALHPQWLRARGQTVGLANATPVTPTVFMDGTRMGELDVLNAYQVRDIEEIRYLDPGRAASRYGMGYPRGIIEIISLRR
ncbi:MAG: hypothetical protein OXE73_01520 [Gammaproteobacteria bacterium]|nr:hypothetical protein [Gammaproteobacteria bacterium]